MTVALLRSSFGRLSLFEAYQEPSQLELTIHNRISIVFNNELKSDLVQRLTHDLLAIRDSFWDLQISLEEIVETVQSLDKEEPFISRKPKCINFLAWMVQDEMKREPGSLFAQKGTDLLFALGQLETGWLADLFPEKQERDAVDCAMDLVVDDFAKKAYTLFCSRNEWSPAQCAALTLLCDRVQCVHGYFKKELYGLPRTLHGDPEHNQFYILDKGKRKFKVDDCAFKKVTPGLSVPATLSGSLGWIVEATTKEKTESAVEELFNEATLQKELYSKAKAGIWPVLSICKQRREQGKPRISVIYPMADGSLYSLVRDYPAISDRAVVDMMKELCCGLDAIHSSRYIHGDIKRRNVLYDNVDGDKVTAGLSDFGHTGSVEEMYLLFSNGSYGSRSHTAPELLGVRNFSGNLFAVDMWAFGCMLYSFYFRKSPAWFELLREDKNDIELMQREMCKLICQEIEKPREALLKRPTSVSDKIKLFIYDCMRLDPLHRLDISGALKRISKF